MVFGTQTCYTNRVKQDVFDKLPHLTKRYCKYGIRVRVPENLRELIGKREITRSLGTGDPVEALSLYYEKLAEVQAELDDARRSLNPPEPNPLSVDAAKSIAVNYFREQIYTAELEAEHVANDVHSSAERLRDNCREWLVEIARDLQDIKSAGEHYVVGFVDELLRANDFPVIVTASSRKGSRSSKSPVLKKAHVDETSPGYKALLRWAYLGQIEVLERQVAILTGEHYDVSKSTFGSLSIPLNSISHMSSVHTNSATSPLQTMTLSELFDRFMAAHERKSERWKLDMRTSIRPLIEIVGADTDANSISKNDFRNVLAFMRKMPTQIGNNRKKWEGKTLLDIVRIASGESQNEEGFLHPKTINKYMGRISQVMKWAEAEPLIDRNHASGILIPSDEIEDEQTRREPFSDEALEVIFRSDKISGPSLEEPSMYWATLFALFHGMRSEEILQLRSSDFKADKDGILFIEIHKRDGNHLKNKSAIRKVPVHPQMEELGLKSLLCAAENSEYKSLFRDIMRGAEGKFTPSFSRRYVSVRRTCSCECNGNLRVY